MITRESWLNTLCDYVSSMPDEDPLMTEVLLKKMTMFCLHHQWFDGHLLANLYIMTDHSRVLEMPSSIFI